MLLMVWNQANHRFTTKMQRRIYGQATNAAIRPLNEEKAVQAAADLLGELFIFTVLMISSSYLWSEIVTKYSLVYVTWDACFCIIFVHAQMPLLCFNIGLKLVDILTGGGGFVILPLEGMVLVLLKYVTVVSIYIMWYYQLELLSYMLIFLKDVLPYC